MRARYPAGIRPPATPLRVLRRPRRACRVPGAPRPGAAAKSRVARRHHREPGPPVPIRGGGSAHCRCPVVGSAPRGLRGPIASMRT
jgi:hypothetical protein